MKSFRPPKLHLRGTQPILRISTDAHYHMEGIGEGIAKRLNDLMQLTIDAKQYRTWLKQCGEMHDCSSGLNQCHNRQQLHPQFPRTSPKLRVAQTHNHNPNQRLFQSQAMSNGRAHTHAAHRTRIQTHKCLQIFEQRTPSVAERPSITTYKRTIPQREPTVQTILKFPNLSNTR